VACSRDAATRVEKGTFGYRSPPNGAVIMESTYSDRDPAIIIAGRLREAIAE